MKLIIRVSMQHIDEIQEAKEFNQENEFKYLIETNGNVLFAECMTALLNWGYTCYSNTEGVITFKHKNYSKEVK